MKTLRLLSVWSVLPLMLVWEAWSWLEDALVWLGTQRENARSGR